MNPSKFILYFSICLLCTSCYTTQRVYRSDPQIDKSTASLLGSKVKANYMITEREIIFQFYEEERYKAESVIEVVREKVVNQEAMQTIANLSMMAANIAMEERSRKKNNNNEKDDDTTAEDIIAVTGYAAAASSAIVNETAGPKMVTSIEKTFSYYTEKAPLKERTIPIKIKTSEGNHIGTILNSEFRINPYLEWDEMTSSPQYIFEFKFRYEGDEQIHRITIPTKNIQHLTQSYSDE